MEYVCWAYMCACVYWCACVCVRPCVYSGMPTLLVHFLHAYYNLPVEALNVTVINAYFLAKVLAIV